MSSALLQPGMLVGPACAMVDGQGDPSSPLCIPPPFPLFPSGVPSFCPHFWQWSGGPRAVPTAAGGITFLPTLLYYLVPPQCHCLSFPPWQQDQV